MGGYPLKKELSGPMKRFYIPTGVLVILLITFMMLSCSQEKSPKIAATQNQQPIEVVSVLERPQDPNPGGGIVEITLKNVGVEPVLSLTAILTIRGPFNYYFDVTPTNPLLPGKSVSSQLRLIGPNDGFGDGIPYSLAINGTLHNGSTFAYTWESPNK